MKPFGIKPSEHRQGGLLESVFRTLPPDVACRIADLDADEPLQQRVELPPAKPTRAN